MNTWTAVVLAAGKGKRMKSRLPKVLHQICGQPMVSWVVQAVQQAGARNIVMVVGHGAEHVSATVGDGLTYVEQREQLGTGHALLQARPALEGKSDHVLVINGDTPFIRADTLARMMEAHSQATAVLTMLTCDQGPNEGLGRIVRDNPGRVAGIVEDAEATESQRAIREINVGAYCFDAAWLWENLPRVHPAKTGEIYLTALLRVAHDQGRTIEALKTDDPMEAIGVDTRLRLAQAEAFMRQRIREQWMAEGVTLVDPPSTFIDATVNIGQDTIIRPFTTLSGHTLIGEGCDIGPSSIIVDSTIGANCRVLASVVEESVLEERVDMGPFSHLRPGSHIETGVHIGNFVEVKKSRIGRDSASGHFSYIGDATIGHDVNVGAGTITCNFDGVSKLPTVIEDGVFLGCDTMLVAPVKVGARSKTGAGAVVTKDVPPDVTVVGVPARPLPTHAPGGGAAKAVDGPTAPTPANRKT